MIKIFCDKCGNEITEDNTLHLTTSKKAQYVVLKGANGAHLSVALAPWVQGGANNGQFCFYCVLDALLALDDRPKPEAAHRGRWT